jgi:Zn-dependent protease
VVILVTGVFGWGKPAPYDPFNLRHPRQDTALIALAGPASNIVLAIILSAVLHFVSFPAIVYTILIRLIIINVSLSVFNLMPVPPLDGSKIIGLFMSNESALRFQNQNGLMLLVLILLPIFGGYSIASIVISPIATAILRILLPS